MTTIEQPILPAEGVYTRAELEFISLQPPGLWPDGQDSNFGQVRKVVTDILQENIDQLTTLWNEMFPSTATDYLSQWEEMLGLPVDETKSVVNRRAGILTARRYGGFTRTLIRGIIDELLTATFGDAIRLTPAGVAMSVGGVPLFADASSLIGLARVYENVRAFSYEVWIKSTTTPDMTTLLRRLQRITPAGITVTVDNTKLDVLDYFRLVRNAQPGNYYRLNGNATDSSGYGITGTINGGPIGAIASPGLLNTNVVHTADAGMDFDGVDDNIFVPSYGAPVKLGVTIEAIVRPDALPSAGNYGLFFSDAVNADSFVGVFNNGGTMRWVFALGAPANRIEASTPVVGTTARVTAKYDGTYMRLFVNGVKVGERAVSGALVGFTGGYYIGRWTSGGSFWNGGMDEHAVYNYALSDADIKDHSDTSQDIATY